MRSPRGLTFSAILLFFLLVGVLVLIKSRRTRAREIFYPRKRDRSQIPDARRVFLALDYFFSSTTSASMIGPSSFFPASGRALPLRDRLITSGAFAGAGFSEAAL